MEYIKNIQVISINTYVIKQSETQTQWGRAPTGRPPHWVCASDYLISKMFMDIPYQIYSLYTPYIFLNIFHIFPLVFLNL